MDEQTRKLVDELRAAESKRTPGEWEYGISGYTWNVHKASDKHTVASVPYSRIFDDDMALKEQNAAFIALCSRAVPALLAAFDSAERERDALRAALEPFATAGRRLRTEPNWYTCFERENCLRAAAVLYGEPKPPAPPSVDWRADCLAWLASDGHRYVAFRPLDMPLTYPNLSGVTWDDGSENIALVFLADAVTDAVIENARKVRTEYMGAQHLESAFALIVVPAGRRVQVKDDAIAVAEWTGERVTRV